MISLELVVTSIALLVFSLLLVLAAFRVRLKDVSVLLLTLYLALGVVATLSHLTDTLQLTQLPGTDDIPFSELALLAMVLTFGGLTLAFLRKPRSALLGYWIGALVVLLLWNVFAFNVRG